ncbi:MAG: ABC transporter ATP-binding protein [Saccharofermentanaceae bacterium]|jgi:ABC-2 type transport system ATP-binding protein|nr:ABC transporter ATP-binding protein [Clostridia bacterium]NLX69155.1 ABC transporter ATP-binding protein [Clostridiaceae bacterium]HOO49048.1 ABC transporter ATP-binding protein [Saccharofermentans sp.]HPE28401.1 ABC transporter ATP-binding protein [Saccharofermentans sp.]HPQ32277.1 ABC transporter ATP-binding protein [Saccharofermentans sp.]
MLSINNLTKTYRGSSKGVHEVSLEIESGDIYGFIGPNGAGKTTTIKCVVGILSFQEGSITIDGVSIIDNPIECKKKFAYIPDNPDIYDYLTGIQYLNFIADVFEVSAQDREEKIKKYARAFEIEESLGDLVSSYSHGMKQKLAIISAMIHEPKLLILDEPFVGLDPQASVVFKDFMREMCSKGGAVFFSTHVLDVAERLCTRVAIIKDGRIITSGKMEDIVTNGNTLESIFLEVAGDDKANI